MNDSYHSQEQVDDLVHILGYMNFSSGRTDLKMFAAVNRLFGHALRTGSDPARPHAGMPAWLTLQQWLQDHLQVMALSQPAFSEEGQAADVLAIVWKQLLPAYTDFHRDLLFHQEPEGLFNGLFLGRAIQAVVAQGSPWDDVDRIVGGVIRELNSFVGYRPVAVLETGTLEPYPHEWVCPIPLYIDGVGIATGPYERIIELALQILRDTAPQILRNASFDPSLLVELAVDPRAYDFDHPVNKRPNYQFGTWDFRSADEQGYYRRFVIQQITLDALNARVFTDNKDLPQDELLFEAATVLAGTMLMASGITGWGPTANDSTVSLTSLLGPIASYRDQFYADVLSRMDGPHALRLREEETRRRQPFGGARQNLNAFMARKRAAQLGHVQLARLFARMGSTDSARAETDEVPVPSARMMCRIDCLLTHGKRLLSDGLLQEAMEFPADIIDLLHRGIECGAFVDPWNILGFAGNFPYFPSSDAASEDHRIGEINDLLVRIASFFSRIWREAAAKNDTSVAERIRLCFLDLANWWHQFAAHELSEINGINLLDSYQSAELVARALRLWHAGGASAGDVRFWGEHAELFDSPRAYALVIEALLEREDFVASLALLVHWLSESSKTGLRSGETSFAEHAEAWFYQATAATHSQSSLDATIANDKSTSNEQGWKLCKRFFDYIEANADDYWQPLHLILATQEHAHLLTKMI